MKKILLAASLMLSSLAFAQTYEIDAAHAGANFSVKHLMVSTVQGTLGDVTGTITYDGKDATKATIEVSIDVKGINTKQVKRDEHLRSADFFDVEKFPTATFKSSKITKGKGNKIKVAGMLTMHGVSKEVTLDGELSNGVANPWSGAKTFGFSGTTKLNRKDFGLTWNKGLEAGGVLVGEEVNVEVDAEFAAKKEEAAAPAPAPAPVAAPVKKEEPKKEVVPAKK